MPQQEFAFSHASLALSTASLQVIGADGIFGRLNMSPFVRPRLPPFATSQSGRQGKDEFVSRYVRYRIHADYRGIASTIKESEASSRAS
jgi:hypothetical protein